ncbi:unnamed protein product [Protopolystoma xenopodis]|uniref:Uncharacterized protein n=1 Tax=Protopolystoma xenopodis TaxID=117903 RepID=A0A3S5A9D7_9PLAT|nr:unnamed protein product [Protopolystoma xenopodis]
MENSSQNPITPYSAKKYLPQIHPVLQENDSQIHHQHKGNHKQAMSIPFDKKTAAATTLSTFPSKYGVSFMIKSPLLIWRRSRRKTLSSTHQGPNVSCHGRETVRVTRNLFICPGRLREAEQRADLDHKFVKASASLLPEQTSSDSPKIPAWQSKSDYSGLNGSQSDYDFNKKYIFPEGESENQHPLSCDYDRRSHIRHYCSQPSQPRAVNALGLINASDSSTGWLPWGKRSQKRKSTDKDIIDSRRNISLICHAPIQETDIDAVCESSGPARAFQLSKNKDSLEMTDPDESEERGSSGAEPQETGV